MVFCKACTVRFIAFGGTNGKQVELSVLLLLIAVAMRLITIALALLPGDSKTASIHSKGPEIIWSITWSVVILPHKSCDIAEHMGSSTPREHPRLSTAGALEAPSTNIRL